MPIQEVPGVVTIDTHYVQAGRMSVYLVIDEGRAAFVDTNTAKAVPLLMDALDVQGVAPEHVDYIMVTHVHLDHAAGTAELLKRCPNATALVHPKTKRHLADPSRLVEAAKGIYGEAFDALYGEIEAVPEERMRVMDDGERLEWGRRTLEFFHCLGHATHHYSVYDSKTQGVFTGDNFGICYPQLTDADRPYIFAAATPTEFDPPAAIKTVHRILSYDPAHVFLGHFGAHKVTEALTGQLVHTLDRCADLIDYLASSDLEGSALENKAAERMTAMTHEELRRCGLDPDERTLPWVEPDIQLNTQGILAAVNRRRKAIRQDSPA